MRGTFRTRFEGLHLLHSISAFSQDQPRLQVDLVPFLVREVAYVEPRFFGAPEVEGTYRLAGGVRTRVCVQIGFSDMREHSCQGGDMLELWACFRSAWFTKDESLRTTAYPSFKYSLLKTSLPGSAFGARLR